MTSLRLDNNNNLVVNGDVATINNIDALAQDVKSIVMLHKMEYIYNTNKGVDWLKFLQENDTSLLLSEIESQLYEDSRIKSVSISASSSDGVLDLKINTTSNEEVIVNV